MTDISQYPPELLAQTDQLLRGVLADVLGLSPGRIDALEATSGLFGHMPELDSMAVGTLLAEMEDRLDILIDDEDLDGDILETWGALFAFACAKRAAA